MNSPARLRVGIWLGFVLACAIVVARSQYGADLAAFLPSSPSPTQRFLVDELREGVVSRLVLMGVEGAEQDKLAAVKLSHWPTSARPARPVTYCWKDLRA